MKKIKLWRRCCLMILGIFFAGFFLNGSAFADMPDYQIGITPTQKDLGELEPGETYTGSYKVKNTGAKTFDFKMSFLPYTVKDETYEPVYSENNTYTEITKWITLNVMEGTLDSGQEQVIEYTISVPEDVHGGAQAATIISTMYPPESEASGNSVATTQQLGYVLYGNVDGEVIKTGEVLENNVPSFLFNPPIIGTSLVENTGNVYTRAEYKLQVFPLFSDEEVYTNEETPENNIVFPETKRYNEIKWEGAPQLGIFKVRQTVKIFDDESVTEKLVFLCPIWFLFIVILLVFLIIFWIVSRVIKRKREA